METYADLIAQVEERLGRTNLANQYQTWVTTAEKNITQKLRVREMENVGTIEPMDGKATPPSDFCGVGEIRKSDDMTKALEYASPKMLFRLDDPAFAQKDPQWSILGKDIYIRPTPVATQWSMADGGGFWDLADGSGSWGTMSVFWMRYFAKPMPLSSTVSVNALFPEYSNIYLYMTLAEGFKALRNWESADRYTGQALALIEENNQQWLIEQAGEGSLEIEPMGPTP